MKGWMKVFCEKCKQHPAQVRYTYMVNGVGKTLSLCGGCYDAINEKDSLLAGWLFPGALGKNIEKKCDLCGYAYAQIAKEGRVGCARCYGTFRQELLPQLSRIHGNKTHVSSHESNPKMSELDVLQKQMEQAVEREDFEAAARFRDEIKKLREEGK